MRLKPYLLVAALISAATIAHAQNSKDNGRPPADDAATLQRQSLQDARVYKKTKTKAFKWKRRNVKHTAQYEYYDRVEAAAREHKRTLRKLNTPQYYDFMYYGHKRKPRKHAAGDLRYCKECGIRH